MNATPPKTTRISVVLAIISLLRHEKSPPLTKYGILLTIAASPKPLTSHQIAGEMGDETPQGSALGRLVDAGLIVRSGNVGPGGVYHLTTAGQHEVARILSGQPVQKAGPQPDMQRVLAATAKG